MDEPRPPQAGRGLFERGLALTLVAALLATAFTILAPFGTILLWSLFMSITIWPLHRWFLLRTGGHPSLAATLSVAVLLVLVVAPVVLSTVALLPSLRAILFGHNRPDDKDYASAGREDPRSRQVFRRELEEMVAQLHHFPCIRVWVPFNEGWGQFEARETALWLKKLDPTRLVDHASGWYDQNAGDFKSLHVYFKALPRFKPEKKRAAVLSELRAL